MNITSLLNSFSHSAKCRHVPTIRLDRKRLLHFEHFAYGSREKVFNKGDFQKEKMAKSISVHLAVFALLLIGRSLAQLNNPAAAHQLLERNKYRRGIVNKSK